MVDGINLDEIKEFAKAFKLRRLSLGLTQTQVGQALSITEGPAYSQSAICRYIICFYIFLYIFQSAVHSVLSSNQTAVLDLCLQTAVLSFIVCVSTKQLF